MILEEIPPPKPGEGQALVRIKAAGVNFIDTADVYNGGRSEEVTGLPFGDVLVSDDALAEAIRAQLKGGQVTALEGKLHRRSGETFPVMARLRPGVDEAAAAREVATLTAAPAAPGGPA